MEDLGRSGEPVASELEDAVAEPVGDGDRDPERFYVPSGVAPLFGLLLMVLIALPFAGTAGFLNGLLVAHIAVAYAVVVLFLVILVSFVTYWSARLGHLRNLTWAGLIAFLAGCAYLYGSWGGLFVGVDLGRDLTWTESLAGLWPHLLLPRALAYLWDSGSAGVWIMSIFEVLLTALVPLFLVVDWLDNAPYCEGCGAWTRPRGKPLTLEVVDPPHLKAALLAGHTEALTYLERLRQGTKRPVAKRRSITGEEPPADEAATVMEEEPEGEAPTGAPRPPVGSEALLVKLSCCDACEGSNFLTVTHTLVTPGEKKSDSETTTETDLVKNLRIPSHAAQALQGIGGVANPAAGD